MKKRLRSISIFQTSKVISILYFILTALFLFPYAIYFLINRNIEDAFFAFLAPFLYGAVVFLVFLIITWIYNHLASLIGGIEFTVEEKD